MKAPSSPPDASAWRCGRWPAIRTATRPPRTLAAAANARWAATSAAVGGPPELPSGIPCMTRNPTTAAIQYAAAAITQPAMTPAMPLTTNVVAVDTRSVYPSGCAVLSASRSSRLDASGNDRRLGDCRCMSARFGPERNSSTPQGRRRRSRLPRPALESTSAVVRLWHALQRRSGRPLP